MRPRVSRWTILRRRNDYLPLAVYFRFCNCRLFGVSQSDLNGPDKWRPFTLPCNANGTRRLIAPRDIFCLWFLFRLFRAGSWTTNTLFANATLFAAIIAWSTPR